MDKEKTVTEIVEEIKRLKVISDRVAERSTDDEYNDRLLLSYGRSGGFQMILDFINNHNTHE